jgi:hypothetical protein
MKRLLPVLVAATSVLLVIAASASADLRRATSGDPFAACPSAPDIFGGVVFPSTEPEVWLATNPRDPRNLIGSIQQDRWSDGGAQGLVAPFSRDGGRSWDEVPLPFNECASSTYHGHVLHYDRASDPWVDVGRDGTAYAISISFNANDNANAVGAATSSDGGRTWGTLRSIITDSASDPTLPFNDKESITADPVIPGRAYAVWDRLQDVVCPPGVPPAQGTSDDRVFYNGVFGHKAAAAATAQALDCFDGPAMFSMTRDGGRSWSKPQAIVPPSANEQTIANQIVVDPRTHVLYDFYMYFSRGNTATVEDIASFDGGRTWSRRQRVSDSQTVGVHDPATGLPLRTGDIIPQPAIDPHTGRLYVVWQDPRFNRVDPTEDQLVISSSTFGGFTGTWSPPTLVNDPRDRAAFTPAIKVLPNGRVAVQYYTIDDSGPGGTLPTDLALRALGGPEQSVGRPFNMLAAPFSEGFFTGDYEGAAVDAAGVFHGFATMTNCRNARCAAVAGFDADDNPIPTNAPNPTDVYTYVAGCDRGR